MEEAEDAVRQVGLAAGREQGLLQSLLGPLGVGVGGVGALHEEAGRQIHQGVELALAHLSDPAPS